jgi:hypothetical protein
MMLVSFSLGQLASAKLVYDTGYKDVVSVQNHLQDDSPSIELPRVDFLSVICLHCAQFVRRFTGWWLPNAHSSDLKP